MLGKQGSVRKCPYSISLCIPEFYWADWGKRRKFCKYHSR